MKSMLEADGRLKHYVIRPDYDDDDYHTHHNHYNHHPNNNQHRHNQVEPQYNIC